VRTRENGTHALRHFYASALLDGGENIAAKEGTVTLNAALSAQKAT
jgi:hypothetical protein